MPIYQLELTHRQTVATRTVQLNFAKPLNFQFIPGQYGGFTIINPSEQDAKGMTRRFSLLSSPDDPELAIVTRIQDSAYKRQLNLLSPGELIKFAGPTGSFILHEDSSIPVVMIAGGIGIAPFYSMIRYALSHQQREITLFYGNQTEADAAYIHELEQLSSTHPHFTFIPVIAISSLSWNGETGLIDAAMIARYLKNLDEPIYYICGSPAMVAALQETLLSMNINQYNIRVEDFPGY